MEGKTDLLIAAHSSLPSMSEVSICISVQNMHDLRRCGTVISLRKNWFSHCSKNLSGTKYRPLLYKIIDIAFKYATFKCFIRTVRASQRKKILRSVGDVFCTQVPEMYRLTEIWSQCSSRNIR